MKKQELLKHLDNALLEKLFTFCYARTRDSYEAQELCSDIIFALVKAAHAEGDIGQVYPFVWKVAHHVYADFSHQRRRHAETFYEGDAEQLLPYIAAAEQDDSEEERLQAVYCRIAFLTRAYREVMIQFYIEGLSVADIARRQQTSETAIRQRLFTARKRIKSEVEEMAQTQDRPVPLDTIEYVIWGTGDPAWGDPRNVCTRKFSKHVLWLCRKKPVSAREIAAQLNVPTVYVEEELEILTQGENGQYGLLRRMDNGRYALNFILFGKEDIEKAHALYREQLPKIARITADYITAHKEEYLAFPYRNKKVDWNLILWQQITALSQAFSDNVEAVLAEKYFADTEETDQPFRVFGYVDNGKYYGGGWDGVLAENVCGFSQIRVDNIYTKRIKPHFHCCLNVSSDLPIQLALRAIDGLAVSSLSETEKEHAAKAIECGYLYREGDRLYTKILVSSIQDQDRLFAISKGIYKGLFEKEAQAVAEKLAALIQKVVPDYLLGEWRMANALAQMPVLDAVVEILIHDGVLIPPQDGIGAEGCWMSVMK